MPLVPAGEGGGPPHVESNVQTIGIFVVEDGVGCELHGQADTFPGSLSIIMSCLIVVFLLPASCLACVCSPMMTNVKMGTQQRTARVERGAGKLHFVFNCCHRGVQNVEGRPATHPVPYYLFSKLSRQAGRQAG